MYKDLNTFTTNSSGLDAIRNSIRNILLTPRGSLPGKPRFGADLYKIIFSPIDGLTISMARNFIHEALTEYEDRIEIEEVQIKKVEEYNKLVIDIYFSYRDEIVTSEQISDSVTIAFGL